MHPGEIPTDTMQSPRVARGRRKVRRQSWTSQLSHGARLQLAPAVEALQQAQVLRVLVGAAPVLQVLRELVVDPPLGQHVHEHVVQVAWASGSSGRKCGSKDNKSGSKQNSSLNHDAGDINRMIKITM